MFDKGSAIFFLIGLILMFLACLFPFNESYRSNATWFPLWQLGLSFWFLGFVWVPLHQL